MLLFIIKIYRRFFKRFIQTACLFEPSCSYYVEDVYRSKGPIKGWNALKDRFHNCRPGYHFITVDGESYLVTVQGQSYRREQLSTSLKKEMDAALGHSI
jgi:putative component of membrane protein insertase Oxa1/YidC/SpoIIIJ protein YidD